MLRQTDENDIFTSHPILNMLLELHIDIVWLGASTSVQQCTATITYTLNGGAITLKLLFAPKTIDFSTTDSIALN